MVFKILTTIFYNLNKKRKTISFFDLFIGVNANADPTFRNSDSGSPTFGVIATTVQRKELALGVNFSKSKFFSWGVELREKISTFYLLHFLNRKV